MEAIAFLTPASQRDQLHCLAPRFLAQRRGDFVATQLRHADIEQRNLGPKSLRKRQCSMAAMRDAHFMPTDLQQHRKAVGGVLVVICNEHASTRRIVRHDIGRGGLRGIHVDRRQRQVDGEFAALSGPTARDRRRATVQLDQTLHQR